MERVDFNKETASFTCPVCGREMSWLYGDEWECDYCSATGVAVNGEDGEPDHMDFDVEAYYERQAEEDEEEQAEFRDQFQEYENRRRWEDSLK